MATLSVVMLVALVTTADLAGSQSFARRLAARAEVLRYLTQRRRTSEDQRTCS
jgi:hypothetical protein